MTADEFINNLETITNSCINAIIDIVGVDVNVSTKNIDENCCWSMMTTPGELRR